MIRKTQEIIALLLIAFMASRCTKSYQPLAVTQDYNYLVVEGTINVGPDSTIIKLSRSVKLPAGTGTRPETNAKLSVESAAGIVYTLTERAGGKYFAASLPLDKNQKYRLKILTASGKNYISDFEPVKIVPAIDSIGFTIQNNNLNIYCNSHDPANDTHYYRWDYQETWIYSPPFVSIFISDGTNIVSRRADQFVDKCWRNSLSTNVVIGSSTKLAQDIIYQNVVATIPSNSEKISVKYSIMLREYALTKEAYQFWQNMKTNTENLGSIFDAQPSLLKGNIHNPADINEPVIGYISFGSIQSRRIFIDRTQLPGQWSTSRDETGCLVDIAYFKNPITGSNDVATSLIPIPAAYLPILPQYNGTVFVGYTRTTASCADCTLNGGISKQPSFWK